jgi:hypothetical protein
MAAGESKILPGACRALGAGTGLASSGPAPVLVGAKPFRQADLETNAGYQALPSSVKRVRKMIEAVTIILGLFCAGIFIAHAVDAYLTA